MRLDAVCSIIVDCEHKTAPTDEAGEYFAVGTPAMRDHRIDYSKARRISHKTFEAWTRRLTPRAGDLLFAREAPVGPIVRLPDTANVAPGQRTVLLRPDPKVVQSAFLYYALAAPAAQAGLIVKAAGSTVHHLNVPDIKSFDVWVPSLPEQQAITEVLSALDDKIAANTSLVATTLELADKLFLLQPGESSTRLGDVVSVVKGNSYRSADLAPSDHALVTLKSITRDGRYAVEGIKQFIGRYKPQQIISPGEVVVAQTDLTQAAEVVGRAVRVPASDEYTLIASLDLAIVRPLDGVDQTYLLGLLRQPRFRAHCLSNTTGTTVLHLRSGAIEAFMAQIADSATQQAYARAALPLHQTADSANAENRVLAATRDALLPHLMSGKLRVRDVEAAASEAGA